MNREAIFAALYALWSDIPEIITTGRTLLHWADVPASSRPACFQAQGNWSAPAPAANGLAGKRLLTAKLYLYVSTAGADSPGEVLNPLTDAIEAKFAPTPDGRAQTLGGLVQWARIEGEAMTDEGTLGDDAVAIIPIVMLAT